MFTLHYDAYQAFEEADHDVCFVDRWAAMNALFTTAVMRRFDCCVKG